MCIVQRLWELVLHSLHPELNHPLECRREDSPPLPSPSCSELSANRGHPQGARARQSGKHTVGRITQTAKLPSLHPCRQATDAPAWGDGHVRST